jgi:flagellar motility protein MotE (MotC chaperone)
MLAAPWFLAVLAFVLNAACSFLFLNMEVSKLKSSIRLPEKGPSAAEIAAKEEKERQEKAEAEADEAYKNMTNAYTAAKRAAVWNFKTAAVDELITELKNERQSILEEQKDLAALSSQVTAERQEVERVKAEVTRLRQELEARIVEVTDNEKDNLKKLVSTYTIMPAPNAVPILRELDENTVVKILSQMKPERVALILGAMAQMPDKSSDEPPSKRAARISDKLRLMKALKKEVAQ